MSNNYGALQKKRRRRKFFELRGKLSIPHTIHERLVEADGLLRVGDWECDWELDTIVGKTVGQVLVTLTDHKTRLLKAHKVASKRTQAVMNVIEHFFRLQVIKLKRLLLIEEKSSVKINKSQMNLT